MKLLDFSTRIIRKNSANETDIPLTISSKDGLINQNDFFNKQVASKDMSGYYLLHRGEYAYNKSYSVGYDFGSIKRLEKYDMGALSTLYICFALTKFNSDFIKHYFDSFKWYREIYMISAEGARNHGLLNVPTEDFFATLHTLPTDETEQAKIASFLDALTSRIEKQRSLVENLKKYKRGVSESILTSLSCPAQELSAVCDIIGGGTPDTGVLEYWNGDINWFTPTEVGKKKYVTSSARTITTDGLSKSSAKILPPYTVLLTTRATLGEMSIATDTCCTNQGFQSLVAKKDLVLPEYIYYLQVIIKPWCEKYSSGNTFREISKSALGKCAIPVPSIEKQSKIVRCLSLIDAKIENSEFVLDNLMSMKSALLQRLFI